MTAIACASLIATTLTGSGAAVSERGSSGVAQRGRAPAHAGAASSILAAPNPRSETACTYEQHRFLMRAYRFYSWRVRVWENKMGAGSKPATADARIPKQAQCPRFLAKHMRAKAHALRVRYERWQRERRVYLHRLYEKWRCIHEHEGAWNANTGNGYYGGLQMTRWFQQTYGPEFYERWGTANNWPVYAQLTAAERAWRECQCFRQWGTAGMCGLA